MKKGAKGVSGLATVLQSAEDIVKGKSPEQIYQRLIALVNSAELIFIRSPDLSRAECETLAMMFFVMGKGAQILFHQHNDRSLVIKTLSTLRAYLSHIYAIELGDVTQSLERSSGHVAAAAGGEAGGRRGKVRDRGTPPRVPPSPSSRSPNRKIKCGVDGVAQKENTARVSAPAVARLSGIAALLGPAPLAAYQAWCP